MKYLGPFLIGSIVTVGGFLGVAATVPTSVEDHRTAEQRAADAMMLTPQPLSASQRRPEPKEADRTVTPIAWPAEVSDPGPTVTASLGEAVRPVDPSPVPDSIASVPEPLADASVETPPAPTETPVADDVPLPKPAERPVPEDATVAVETSEPLQTADAIASLIGGSDETETVETPSPAPLSEPEAIEDRLAAAGDLWNQAPAASLAELVSKTESASSEGAVRTAVPVAADPPPTAERAPEAPVTVAAIAAPETDPEPTVASPGKGDGPIGFEPENLPSAGSVNAARVPTSAGSDGMTLSNVVVLDGGGFRAVRDRQGLIVRIAGIEPLTFDKVCQGASGADWRCGAQARAALAQHLSGRMVDCEEVRLLKPKPVREIQAQCALDGQDLAAWLVREGWATPAGDDVRLAEAARSAEENRRGRFGIGG